MDISMQNGKYIDVQIRIRTQNLEALINDAEVFSKGGKSSCN